MSKDIVVQKTDTILAFSNQPSADFGRWLDGRITSVQWLPSLLNTQFPQQSRGNNTSIAWRPDGQRVAVANGKGGVAILDGNKGQVLQHLIGHTDAVTVMDWNPDNRQLATSGADDTLRIWDVAHQTNTAVIPFNSSPDNPLNNIKWDRSGTRVYTYFSNGGPFSAINPVRNQSTKLTGVERAGYLLSQSPSRHKIAFVTPDREIFVVEDRGTSFPTVADLQNGIDFSDSSDWLVASAWTTSEQRTVFGTYKGYVAVWDLANQQLLWHQKANDQDDTGSYWDLSTRTRVLDVAFSADETLLYALSVDGSVRVFDAGTGKVLGTFQVVEAALNDGKFSPDRTRIAIASQSAKAYIIDTPVIDHAQLSQ